MPIVIEQQNCPGDYAGAVLNFIVLRVDDYLLKAGLAVFAVSNVLIQILIDTGEVWPAF